MALHSLLVQNLRILEHLEISLAQDANLFVGENGAGKTSILEAIDILSRGRSFRERRTQPLLRKNAQGLVVSCKLREANSKIQLGIQKTAKLTTLHRDGERVASISSHASSLPVVSMHPDSHQLIQGGAKQRRNYLDWSAFHVKHTFLQNWRDYNKCLRQRNQALRDQCSDKELQVWTHELSQKAISVDRERSLIFEQLKPIFEEYSRRLLPECDVAISYFRGWTLEQDLDKALMEVHAQERQKKTTRMGAHRANLKITLDQQDAAATASRGQQKLIAASLLLAQVEHLQLQQDNKCIVLLDDVRAELDQQHANALLKALQSLGCQVFITAIEAEQIDISGWQDRKVFHVKQGVCAQLE
ncbi:MAG: DNA replication/repair protein RecF [Pseudomonadota bacterium]